MRLKIFILLFFYVFTAKSQNYDTDYFRSPLNIPLRLAGNFGEIRSNHFHAGIDIKIPYIGVPIYAVADGYISRIRVSAGGYGNALYIDHPNGLRTVYGHMEKFEQKIQSYAKQVQYRQNKFELTEYPDTNLFAVKKGELIGYAGNSGYSAGPHLHFEIRDAKEDVPINPELFNFNLTDRIKPKIFQVGIVSLDKNTNSKEKRFFKPYYKKGTYYLNKTIQTSGDFGIQIRANDYMNYVKNTQGICYVKMFVDDTLYFAYKKDKISFEDTRYLNSLIDYSEKQKTKKIFQKLWTEPGNKLPIYTYAKNSGVLNFKDKKTHKIKILLSDCFQNTSTLIMSIKAAELEKKDEKITRDSTALFYQKNNFFRRPKFMAFIPEGTLYTNNAANYKILPPNDDLFSEIHQLNSSLIPVHKNIYYAIKPKPLQKELINKALLVTIDETGNYYPLESSYTGDFIAGKCKCFGKFAIAVDTISPEIKLEKKLPNNNYTKQNKISFIITDNLSGIGNWNANIDKKNIIFEYDAKHKKLFYIFDDRIIYNKNHTLQITVSDKKNNKKSLNLIFFK